MSCSYCGCDCDGEEDHTEKPEVQVCAELIRKVFEFHASGGDLHCIIEDGNVDCLIHPDDEWVGEARRRKEPLRKKRQTYSGLEKAERACLAALWELDIDEREAAVNLAHGF